jgi:hypothetical protein
MLSRSENSRLHPHPPALSSQPRTRPIFDSRPPATNPCPLYTASSFGLRPLLCRVSPSRRIQSRIFTVFHSFCSLHFGSQHAPCICLPEVDADMHDRFLIGLLVYTYTNRNALPDLYQLADPVQGLGLCSCDDKGAIPCLPNSTSSPCNRIAKIHFTRK